MASFLRSLQFTFASQALLDFIGYVIVWFRWIVMCSSLMIVIGILDMPRHLDPIERLREDLSDAHAFLMSRWVIGSNPLPPPPPPSGDWEIEFSINLCPGMSHITKASYQMALTELKSNTQTSSQRIHSSNCIAMGSSCFVRNREGWIL